MHYHLTAEQQEMAEKARKIAVEKFGLEKMICEYDKVVRIVAKGM